MRILAALLLLSLSDGFSNAEVGKPWKESQRDADQEARKPKGVPRNGPLAGMPSQRGAHIDKIRALGDGQWLNLGRPTPDPKWGTALGVSYTCKMAFSPDLRGAFLYGEGVHGGASQRAGREYYNDGLFFYDINAHAWVCCHPGTATQGLTIKLGENGGEVNEKGEPVPIAMMVHGYVAVTYIPELKQFAFMPCPGDYSGKALGHYRKGYPKGAFDYRQGPWTYHADTGKWALPASKKGTLPWSPQGSSYGSVLEYVKSKHALFYRTGPETVFFYDLQKGEWSDAKPSGPKPPFGIEPTACYDRKRERLYMGGGEYPTSKDTNALWIYDIQSNSWIDPKAKDSKLRLYADWGAVMNYDTVSDKVVLMKYKGEKEGGVGVFVYDPETNAWSGPAPFGSESPVGKGEVNGFYDPELNAHFYHVAHDSTPEGTILVYRHKKAAKSREK